MELLVREGLASITTVSDMVRAFQDEDQQSGHLLEALASVENAAVSIEADLVRPPEDYLRLSGVTCTVDDPPLS
jgi:hypothetical protein